MENKIKIKVSGEAFNAIESKRLPMSNPRNYTTDKEKEIELSEDVYLTLKKMCVESNCSIDEIIVVIARTNGLNLPPN